MELQKLFIKRFSFNCPRLKYKFRVLKHSKYNIYGIMYHPERKKF